MNCQKCGADLPSGESFCPHCYTPVSIAQIGPVYVPPEAQAPEEISVSPVNAAPVVHIVYAGFWLRAVAYLVDTIILAFAFAAVASVHPSSFLIVHGSYLNEPPTMFPQLTPLALGVAILMQWLYYAVYESSAWQATPGKRAIRLYVPWVWVPRVPPLGPG